MSPKSNDLSLSSERMTISNQQQNIANSYQNDSFMDYLFDLIKRRWLYISGFTCIIVAAIVYWAFQQSPIYQGKFLLLVEKQNLAGSQTQAENNEVDPEQLQANPNNQPVDYSTEVQLLGSASVLAPILEEIALKYPDIYQDITLNNLNDLEINQVEQSKIIEVLFSDENPEKVQFVLDKISQEYLEKQLNPAAKNIKEGLKVIQSQTSQLQNTVNNLENKLQNLREKYDLIDPQVTTQELTRQVVSTEQEYSRTKVQLEEARKNYDQLQKRLNLTPQQAIAVISLSESKRYQDLQSQLAQIDLEIAKESAIFTEESPVIIGLREKRSNTLKLLESEIAKFTNKLSLSNTNNITNVILNSNSKFKTELTNSLLTQEKIVQQLETKSKQLEKLLTELNKKNAQMPSLIRQYSGLQRELSTNLDSLKRWLKTKEDLEIKEAQNTITWTVVSPPRLQSISELPLSQKNLILIVLGSLTVSIFLAFIIDQYDGSIYNLGQLKRVTLQPVLATIPKNKTSNFLSFNSEENYPSFAKISSEKKENSNTLFELEYYSDIFTNLNLLNADKEIKSVTVSSVDSEGDSTNISVNFAKAVAAMGQKVLLIDTNFKKYQIHKLLGIENSQGLSDILTGEIDISSAIKKVPQQDNLSVITAGNLSNNLRRLFFSPIVKKTLKKLTDAQKFDLIIYDSSSLLLFGTKVIASYTDGVILVVKMGQTKDKNVEQAIEKLKVAQIPLLGVVASGVKN